MPSAFDQRVRLARSRSDATFAEPVHIEPEAITRRARVRADIVDPNLPPFDVVGIFRSTTAINTATTRPTTSDTADVVVQVPTVDFTADQFNADTVPREGWNLTLPSRSPVPRYRIVAVRPDKVVRVTCTLSYVEDVA